MQIRVVCKGTRRRVGRDLEHTHEPALHIGVKVAPGIRKERASNPSAAVYHRGQPKERTKCGWPTHPSSRGIIHSQGKVDRLHNKTVPHTQPLVRWLEANLIA